MKSKKKQLEILELISLLTAHGQQQVIIPADKCNQIIEILTTRIK
jgi:hypothetical protein